MRTSANVLFAAARSAAKSCRKPGGERQYVKHHPLVAVVFSSLSCEAFFNELIEMCTPPSMPGSPAHPLELSKLWCIGRDPEFEGKASLDKYQEARRILCGQPFEKGKLPFQDFKLLFDVRNAIVHARPLDEEEFVWTGTGQARVLTSRIRKSHPMLAKLRSKRLTANTASPENWICKISTPAAACWACNVASKMVKALVDALPVCYTKDVLTVYWQKNWTLQR